MNTGEVERLLRVVKKTTPPDRVEFFIIALHNALNAYLDVYTWSKVHSYKDDKNIWVEAQIVGASVTVPYPLDKINGVEYRQIRTNAVLLAKRIDHNLAGVVLGGEHD